MNRTINVDKDFYDIINYQHATLPKLKYRSLSYGPFIEACRQATCRAQLEMFFIDDYKFDDECEGNILVHVGL